MTCPISQGYGGEWNFWSNNDHLWCLCVHWEPWMPLSLSLLTSYSFHHEQSWFCQSRSSLHMSLPSLPECPVKCPLLQCLDIEGHLSVDPVWFEVWKLWKRMYWFHIDAIAKYYRLHWWRLWNFILCWFWLLDVWGQCCLNHFCTEILDVVFLAFPWIVTVLWFLAFLRNSDIYLITAICHTMFS